MWSTPAATASRKTATASSTSRGGPHTPGPASCIAPYPMRFTFIDVFGNEKLPPRLDSVVIPLLLQCFPELAISFDVAARQKLQIAGRVSLPFDPSNEDGINGSSTSLPNPQHHNPSLRRSSSIGILNYSQVFVRPQVARMHRPAETQILQAHRNRLRHIVGHKIKERHCLGSIR